MKNKLGQVALPFILLVSGIIIEIVIAGSLITYFSSGSGYGSRLNSRAYVAAYSGINDALIKISRDKEFGASNPSYSLTVNDDEADVSFLTGSDTSGNYYVYNIFSLGKAGTREVKLHAVATVSRQNGLINLESIKELTAEE